jgi:hypothetical protein
MVLFAIGLVTVFDAGFPNVVFGALFGLCAVFVDTVVFGAVLGTGLSPGFAIVDEVVVAGFGKAAGLGFAVVEVVGPPGAFFILFLWAIIAAIILFVVPPLSS